MGFNARVKTNPSKHPTQWDVAKAAGVHRSTVSLALRGSPNIPSDTQEKVRLAAEKLGYQPDPMLSALAFYRNTRRTKPYHGTFAWLVNANARKDWRSVTMYEETFLGAKERAPIHGYGLEIFKLEANQLSASRLAGIFRSRNIRGILVCPQPQPNTQLDFPWEMFSSVTFGYSLVRPQLHTIVTSHFRGMLLCMEQIRARGHQRIGLLYSKAVDARVSHYYLAAYLAECHLHGSASNLPPIDPETEDLELWVKKHRPDALVAAGITDLPGHLKKARLKAPEDLAIAVLPLATRNSGYAGIYESSRHIGASAVDTLVGLIQQGIRGGPELPHYTHVDGVWVDGKSLPGK